MPKKNPWRQMSPQYVFEIMLRFYKYKKNFWPQIACHLHRSTACSSERVHCATGIISTEVDLLFNRGNSKKNSPFLNKL